MRRFKMGCDLKSGYDTASNPLLCEAMEAVQLVPPPPCPPPLQNETISAPFATICTSPYAQPPQWTSDSCLCKLANQNPFFHCTEYKRQSNDVFVPRYFRVICLAVGA